MPWRRVEEWRFIFTIHYLCTNRKCVFSFMLLLPYSRGKSPLYPLHRRLGGPQSRSARCEEDIARIRTSIPRSLSLLRSYTVNRNKCKNLPESMGKYSPQYVWLSSCETRHCLESFSGVLPRIRNGTLWSIALNVPKRYHVYVTCFIVSSTSPLLISSVKVPKHGKP
jgi:hypothetical protein